MENGTIRLLLIEDDEEDAILVRAMLARPRWGRYQITRAQSLTLGIEEAARGTHDIALLDLHLPDSEGLDSVSAFLENFPALPVIVMTGLDDRELSIEALACGAQDYLVKGQAETELLERAIRYAMERKRSRDELERGKAQLQALIDGVPELLLLMRPDGTILTANRAARTYLARGACIEGQNAYALFPGEAQAFQQQYVEGALRQQVPFRFEDYHGERRFACCVNPIPGNGAQSAMVMVFALDITARQRAEEQRRQIESKIQHAQKLESLGVLAGGIAHDFNNLLTGILGNAGLLLEDLVADGPLRDAAMRISECATQAAELTRLMLAYSGRASFEVSPIDLSELVRDMANLLAVAISKHITLSLELAERPPVAEADPTQVRQILMNLVTNASDAIGESHGVIAVRTGTVAGTSEYYSKIGLTESLPERAYAFVEVSDDGAGMNPETIRRIFDPFFTTKFAGRGLGLAALRGIVTAHGGGVAVRSQIGHGSTFTVLLPLSQKTAVARLATELDHRQWRGSGRVLVIDDEASVRNVARTILERFGFTVSEAENGREGLAVFDECTDTVAVLLDLTMPVMGGLDTFHEIRRRNPHIPIIVTSGYAEEDVRNRLEGIELAAFLHKPFHVGALVGAIHRLIEKEVPPEGEPGSYGGG